MAVEQKYNVDGDLEETYVSDGDHYKLIYAKGERTRLDASKLLWR